MKTRVLTVSTDFWTATARWVFRDDQWEPVIFDKELNFLKGLDAEGAKDALKKLGCRWSWSAIEERAAQTMAGS